MQKETKQMRLFRRKSKWDRMLGTMATMAAKAGRGRYEQIRELAQTASKNFEASDLRERLETYRARLEAHSSRTGTSKT